MNLVIERDGQTWCFNVTMGMETLTVTLRAYYDGPRPGIEQPYGVSTAPFPERYWRGSGGGTISATEIPRPEWLKDAMHDAIRGATFMRGF
jgi:hypothetical protein